MNTAGEYRLVSQMANICNVSCAEATNVRHVRILAEDSA